MIYLSFHKPHLKDSLNYVVKKNLMISLKKLGLSYTLNPDVEREYILFTSGYDFCYELKQVKENDKVIILALSDPNDLSVQENKTMLATDSLNAYQKADILLVFTDEQKNFLIQNGFSEDKIKVLDLMPTYEKEELLESERNSFRAFFQIPKESKLILFLGNDLFKKDISQIEDLATLAPDKRFLCFGSFDKFSIKEKKKEMLASMSNILFFDNIDEELYRSAIRSVDCVILYTKSQTFPVVLNDFFYFGTKIIAYKQNFNLSFLKKINASSPEDFPSLYQLISSL